MHALLIGLICLAGYLLAYLTYGKFIAARLFRLDPARRTPAHEFRDGVDHVPSRPVVLFGHHFATIAGLGPLLGPAVAVIWGWLPALLWVFFGSIFFGAVHDLSALAVSLRHQGRSIGDVTRELVGVRAQWVFLILIFFALALAMGVFTLIIATLFGGVSQPGGPAESYAHPEAVVPSFSLVAIAVLIGLLVYRWRVGLSLATLLGLALMMVMLVVGVRHPVTGVTQTTWVLLLLVYALVASVLPVWLLLQPRDYLNSFQLYLGMGLMYAGMVVGNPRVVAPAVNRAASDLPPLFPFLFIVVACGAVSGFHSLVSSGTTVKQLDRENHALPIGYGGMLTEGALATVAILACTAGLGTSERWHALYHSWGGMQNLGGVLEAFVSGAGSFVAALGIPEGFARAFVSVMAVGFALTTLDSATRLLRYNVEEMGRSMGVRPFMNRYAAALVAVAAIGSFAFLRVGGRPMFEVSGNRVLHATLALFFREEGRPVGLTLWELFGTTNQLLAALALVAATVYLFRLRRPVWYTLVPALFMFVATVTAMVLKLQQFWHERSWTLFVVGILLLVAAVWVVTESASACAGFARERPPAPSPPQSAPGAGGRSESSFSS